VNARTRAPLRNRVDPFGELFATEARGTWTGNRGGRFHRDDQTLGTSRWTSRRWIVCALAFKGRWRAVWGPRGYTDLFFHDEATALAAGHRPCHECRRADARHFLACTGLPRLDDIDRALDRERRAGRAKRSHPAVWADLPDGVVAAIDGRAMMKWRGEARPWTGAGWGAGIAPPAGDVALLTPPTTVAALAAGYVPAVVLT
jgi:hypothetical protein